MLSGFVSVLRGHQFGYFYCSVGLIENKTNHEGAFGFFKNYRTDHRVLCSLALIAPQALYPKLPKIPWDEILASRRSVRPSDFHYAVQCKIETMFTHTIFFKFKIWHEIGSFENRKIPDRAYPTD